MVSTAADRSRSKIPLAARRLDAAKLLKAQFAPDRVALVKPLNVGLVAERAAEKHGRVPIYLDQPFTWDPEQRVELDYVEFATLIDQMAAVMKAAGVKRWDRVVIVKTPNYDIQALAWAAARIGAIPALLSARLDPDIINILLERLQGKFLITDPEVAKYARLDGERLRHLGMTAIADIDGGIPVADLWGGRIPAPSPLKDDEPMMITHTSSTTGVSKLADACAKGVTYNSLMESIFPGFHTPGDLFASAISHVHIRAAITQAASFSRGTPLLGIAKPDNETMLRLLPQYRPTILESHPNNFMGWETLIDDPSEPFSSIRLYFNSFDAMHPRTIQAMLDASKRKFPVWLQCYGMTETEVVSVRPYTRGSFARLKGRDLRSVGWEVPGIRARIADPETGKRRSDQSQPGMIQVKTPSRAMSFIGTPEKFAERRHGKWFDTGDWGRRGRLGQIEILDRIADRIEGVESCLWIEDVLLERIPNAEEIVVVPDEQGKPVPVVCMRDGKPLDPEVWRSASAGITGLGVPLEVTPDDLQRTATVKARRYLLTEMIKHRDNGGLEAVEQEIVLRDGA
ncbi:class I adenylate-forming enzyme family protein [Actinacidiphila alni]|uniref:class I adenylate-forming enzyme family protein n=1 Tax=Actinacidiphila alni TaxID=380248 RepID=UPI003452861F